MRKGVVLAKVWKRLAFVSHGVLFVVMIGCGGKSEKRYPVTGKVTLDSQPLGEGTITFTPIGKGLSSGGTIQNGSYSIPEDQGPSEGKFKVAVNSRKATGKSIKGRDNSTVPETAEIVAPQFNATSGLTADIGSGKSEHNFDVKAARYQTRRTEGEEKVRKTSATR